jgi:hypothetical protein
MKALKLYTTKTAKLYTTKTAGSTNGGAGTYDVISATVELEWAPSSSSMNLDEEDQKFLQQVFHKITHELTIFGWELYLVKKDKER